MSTEQTRSRGLTVENAVAGALAGLAAGIAMGVILHAGANIMDGVGALYGWPTVIGGWIAHLLNSVLFAVVFVWLISRPRVRSYAETLAGTVGLGIGYGTVLGLVTGGVLLPLWLGAAGASTLPVPLLPIPGVVEDIVVALSIAIAHLVYGAILGGVYFFVRDVEIATVDETAREESF